jgi:cyclohexa-1,5-dienecarbonyl-CoA hydratase
VILDVKVPRATLILNRPPLNILDIATMEEIIEAIKSIHGRSDIGVVVISSASEKAFCAGVDIKDHIPQKVPQMLKSFHAIFEQLLELRAITIAQVAGYCLGGGCELALFCDFVVASEDAIFGQPEIEVGCFPPVAAVLYPRFIGEKATIELLTTGRRVSAQEALKMGLINRVVPREKLGEVVDEIVSQLAQKSPVVLRLTKEAISRACFADLSTALREAERIYLEKLLKTEDMQEGITSFLQKRKPVWKGK